MNFIVAYLAGASMMGMAMFTFLSLGDWPVSRAFGYSLAYALLWPITWMVIIMAMIKRIRNGKIP